MKRERLEDLGRIREKLESLNEEFFSEMPMRFDNFIDRYSHEDSTIREERLEELFRIFNCVDNMMSEVLLIARGHDDD